MEEELNKKLNDIFIYVDKNFPERIAYMDFISFCISKSRKIFLKYFSNLSFDFDLYLSSKVSFIDNISFLQKFYNDLGISLDIDRIINSGALEIKYNDNNLSDKSDAYDRFSGFCSFDNKNVFVNNNECFYDMSLIVHEFSHYRNNTTEYKNMSGLITEALAYLDQFIFLDYCLKYFNESEIYALFYRDLINIYNSCILLHSHMDVLRLFNKYGKVSRDNFIDFFGDDINYDDEISKEYDVDLFKTTLLYSLTSLLTPYLFMKYKNDNSFIKIINHIHEHIDELSLEDFLNIIGLSEYKDDMGKVINTLLESLDSLCKMVSDKKYLVKNMISHPLYNIKQNVMANNNPFDEIKNNIMELSFFQKACKERNIKVPENMQLPQKIIISKEVIDNLLKSKIYYLGTGDNPYQLKFYYEKTKNYSSLEAIIEKDVESDNYYLVYLRDYGSLTDKEFIWDANEQLKNGITSVIYSNNDALEDVTDMSLYK